MRDRCIIFDVLFSKERPLFTTPFSAQFKTNDIKFKTVELWIKTIDKRFKINGKQINTNDTHLNRKNKVT